MRKSWLSVIALASMLVPLLHNAPVRAQSAKTWVANFGSDANDCSRLQPCATFQRAHEQTAAGGEVGVLTPGDYGASSGVIRLSIRKSIAITNDGSGEATILAGGPPVGGLLPIGVLIDAGAGDVVSLRGLVIDGLIGGGSGIAFLQASALHVQNCVIRNFEGAPNAAQGIVFAPEGNGQLFVSDTIIYNNGSSDRRTGAIFITNTNGGSTRVVLDRVHLENNVVGLFVDGSGSTGSGNHVTVRDSVVSGNAGDGIWSLRPIDSGSSTIVLVERTAVVGNTGAGVLADGGGIVQLTSSALEYNGTGASVINGGRLFTYQNNVIDNNVGEDLSPAAIARVAK